jgi:hypothetical protein
VTSSHADDRAFRVPHLEVLDPQRFTRELRRQGHYPSRTDRAYAAGLAIRDREAIGGQPDEKLFGATTVRHD